LRLLFENIPKNISFEFLEKTLSTFTCKNIILKQVDPETACAWTAIVIAPKYVTALMLIEIWNYLPIKVTIIGN